MRKILYMSGIVLIACCLILSYGCASNIPLKDSQQVAFIRTFVSAFGQTDVFDSKNLIRDKLYDSKVIGKLYEFGWYHAAAVFLKEVHSVHKDKTKEITECMDYLSKTYPSKDIEAYEVQLESVLDIDMPKTIKKSSYDVFYLTKKDEKYCLIYTQTLFENSKGPAKAETSLNTYINPNDIEWVTMQGRLDIHTKVLFPGHDDGIINKVVALINSGTGKTASTKTEINVINSEARPLGILFKLKNGSKVYAWTDYTTKSFKDGWSATTLDDRFMLNTQNSGQDEYYTILSRDVASYLREGWEGNMPIVKEVEVSSGTSIGEDKVVIRDGGTAVVTGDGCTAKEVMIQIMRNGNPKEKYIVGKVAPVFGRWEWRGPISRQCKTLDGKTVTLAKDLYDIIAEMDENQTGVCGVIDFRDEKKTEN